MYGEDGSELFDFRAEGVLGFTLDKTTDLLVPSVTLPMPVPRIHVRRLHVTAGCKI